MPRTPDLSSAAESESFRSVITRASKLLSVKPGKSPHKHSVLFKVKPSQVASILRKHQKDLLKDGAYLVALDITDTSDRATRLALFPTTDWQEIITLIGTDAPNWDLTTADIVRALKKVYALTPFTLTAVGEDFVRANFDRPIKNVNKLSDLLMDLAPDMAECHLPEELRRTQSLDCWWD